MKSGDGKTESTNRLSPGSISERSICWLLFFVALMPRIWMLGRAGLWQDEMIFVSILATPGADMVEVFRSYWNHLISMGQMPFAGIMQNRYIAMLGSFGIEDAVYRPGWMRLPMALLGAGAVPGIYGLARLYANRAEALIAALLAAFSFYPIFYSREAYCYAHVMFFSAWGIYFWFRFDEHRRWKDFSFATLCLAGMAWSHLGAVVAVSAWALAAGLRCVWAWRMRQPRGQVITALWSVVPPALSAVLVSPWLIHFMRHNTAHIGSGTETGPVLILHDAVSKMFLGEWPPLALLAWVILLVAMWQAVGLIRKDPLHTFLWITVSAMTGLILLTVATLNTQYISARYFSPLMVFGLLLFARGMYAIGMFVAASCPLFAKVNSSRVVFGLLLVCLAPHLFIYLPVYWGMKQRHEDFAGVAQWLNEHLEPGSVYLLESAYQYRFIGGYHPTPSLLPAAPYVHGGGVEELKRLQAHQRSFLKLFPESPLITLGHPDADDPEVRWQWPYRYFRNQVVKDNRPLHRLIRMGIYPGVPNEELDESSYSLIIHYNTLDDRRALAVATGMDLLFSFPKWQVQAHPVSPQEIQYFRVIRETPARIHVKNPHPYPVSGKLSLYLVWWNDGGSSRGRIEVNLGEERVYSAVHPVGQVEEVLLDSTLWGPGLHDISLNVPGLAGGRALLGLVDLRWDPDPPDTLSERSAGRAAMTEVVE